MVPSVQHLYQKLLSVLHTVLHISMYPSKVLQVQNTLRLDASSFRAKFAGNGWLRGTVVERRSLAGELSRSCARRVVDGRPLMRVNRPL